MSQPIRAGAAGLALFVSMCSGVLAAAEEAAEQDTALEEQEVLVLRSAPVSSTSYSFSELESRGIHGLADMVAGNSAGLLIQPSEFNSSSLGLTLRGISGTTPHQVTGESGVGVFIDGTYIARTQGLSLDLLDIESVEVVRGSQGVLGGRNTSGGAVYLSSSKPTGKFGLEQKFQFGEVGDEVTSITHLNLPRFADVLSVKISHLVHNHDGWVENIEGESGNNNFWVRDNEGTRFAFQVDQGGPFVYDYSFLDAEIKSTAPYFQVLSSGGPFDLEPDFQEDARDSIALPESDIDVSHHNQTVTVRGDRATVTAIVAYREVESREFFNFDDRFNTSVDVDVASGDGNRIEQEQFSQQLRLDTQFF